MTAGLLLAGAQGAGAADAITLPKADAPVLLDATVSGCHAPCAPGETGEVAITFSKPDLPSNAPDGTLVKISVYADGELISRATNGGGFGPGTETRKWTICSGIRQPFEGCTQQSEVDELRGAEEITLTAQYLTFDDDEFVPHVIATGPVSELSNGLVPTQLP